ncbi:hypothetical protein VIGAN_07155100 [Vigna angularis var. angularis]|uniref:Aspergillus nuclease S1 n=1 Tax=Vigna angularis var. angularis TaxID=157739 RepID=A0A0S3SIX0_PHAAN|nr:hypothetical protein VIGAN_07155100 [Vigna angularis var. angularis]
MGDVHQPLHVGFTSDKGGNLINIHWYRRKQNLHHVWDVNIIETAKERFYDSDINSFTKAIQENITDIVGILVFKKGKFVQLGIDTCNIIKQTKKSQHKSKQGRTTAYDVTTGTTSKDGQIWYLSLDKDTGTKCMTLKYALCSTCIVYYDLMRRIRTISIKCAHFFSFDLLSNS